MIVNIAGPILQIGVVCFGIDMTLGVMNGGQFPLTNKFIGIGSHIVAKAAGTVIQVAGPVKGSLILGAAILYTAEKLEITNIQKNLNNLPSAIYNGCTEYVSSWHYEYDKKVCGEGSSCEV
jgi:hypothetical protein